MNDFLFYIKKNKNINNSFSHKFLKVSSFSEPQKVDSIIYNNCECVQISSNSKKIIKKDRFILLSNSRLDNLEEVKEKNPELSNLSEEEIFLELFIRYGESSLKKITGPFSFLIICIDTGVIHGGRDLFGQRPLYYCNNNDFFIAASNIDVFFEFGISRELDDEKILQFILSDHCKDGKTFYREINKVNGGYSFSFINNNINLKRFMKPKDLITKNSIKGDLIRDFKNKYVNVISSIVKKVDGNYATTLSGGLDSSSISLIASSCDEKKQAYSHSVHFHGLSSNDFKKTDEKNYVDTVIRNSSLIHTYINLDYKKNGPLYKSKNYQMISQPYGIINGYVHESIYEECRKKNIKYLFDGLFGDEIVSHGAYRLNELLKRGSLFSFFYELIMLRLNGVINSLRNQINIHLIKPIKNIFKSPFSLSRFNTHDLSDFSGLLSKNKQFDNFLNKYKTKRQSHFKSDLDEQLKLFDSGLIEFSLEQLYEISAINNVECIYPFLDNRIISQSLIMPSSMKLKNGITRYYFKEAMKSILPRELYERQSKSNISPFSYNQISENIESIFDNLSSDISLSKKYINIEKFKSTIVGKKLSTQEALIIFNLLELNKWNQ